MSPRLLASLAIALIALSGCSSTAGVSTSSGTSADNCADYLTLSASDQVIVANSTDLTATAVYSESGAKVVSPADLLAQTCAKLADDTSLLMAAAKAIKAVEPVPMCTEYMELEPSVQQDWALTFFQTTWKVGWDAGGIESQWGNALTLACGVIPSDRTQDIESAARALVLLKMNDPQGYAALMGTVAPPTAPTGANFTLTATSADGYTADLTASVSALRFTSSIVNAAPGKVDIESPVNAAATVTNTTPGRDASTSLLGVMVFAVYEIGSPACQLAIPNDETISAGWVSPTACYLQVAGLELLTVIPSGSSAQMKTIQDSYGSRFAPGTATREGIPEAGAQELLSSLNSPAGFAVMQIPPKAPPYWSLSPVCTREVQYPGGKVDLTVAATTSPLACS